MSDSCDPMEYSPPGSSVHGIFQARMLEWVAISFSRGSSQPRDRTQVSCTAGRFFTKTVIQKKPLVLSALRYFIQRWRCLDLSWTGATVVILGDSMWGEDDQVHAFVSSSVPVRVMKMTVKSLSHVQLFATPWTVAYQAPLSTGFSRQEYWGGLPFSSPGNLTDPEIELGSPTL